LAAIFAKPTRLFQLKARQNGQPLCHGRKQPLRTLADENVILLATKTPRSE